AAMALPINLPHHDVDGADDGGDVGDEGVPRDLVAHREVGHAGGAGADAEGDVFLGVAAADVEAHLATRAFGLTVGFAGVQVLRQLHAVRALGRLVLLDGLAAEPHRLDDFQHADVVPVPAVADDRVARGVFEGRDGDVEVVGLVAAVRLE